MSRPSWLTDRGVRVLAAMATGSVTVSGHSAAAYRASTGTGGCQECVRQVVRTREARDTVRLNNHDARTAWPMSRPYPRGTRHLSARNHRRFSQASQFGGAQRPPQPFGLATRLPRVGMYRPEWLRGRAGATRGSARLAVG
jgi:hypothetical protein